MPQLTYLPRNDANKLSLKIIELLNHDPIPTATQMLLMSRISTVLQDIFQQGRRNLAEEVHVSYEIVMETGEVLVHSVPSQR